MNKPLETIEFSLNNELPQFTQGKTGKALEELSVAAKRQHVRELCERYLLDNVNNEKHTINIISTNNSFYLYIQCFDINGDKISIQQCLERALNLKNIRDCWIKML